MGAILAKFRKEKTTYQVLETLEEKIKKIEEFSLSTQERQRRYVGNILVISIGLYVIAFVIFYFLFFPPTWLQRALYSTPLLIFPFVIILLKRLVTWFYQLKLNKNAIKLKALREDKKKIIEKVMDTETYKVAVDILNRFDTPHPNGNKLTIGGNSPLTSNAQSHHHKHQHKTHNTDNPSFPAVTPYRSPAINHTPTIQRPQQSSRQYMSPAGGNPQVKPSPFQSPASSVMRTPQTHTPLGRPQQQQHLQQQQSFNPHTPYPIINHNQKGYLEKMVDFLIGDGLSNRFGMICKECYGHNGMASCEEYEYSAFRCAFCKTLNPARKLRPIAPKINSFSESKDVDRPVVSSSGKANSSSDGSSSSDSEQSVATNRSTERPAVVKRTDSNNPFESDNTENTVPDKKND